MKTNTSEQIIDFIKFKKQATVKELVDYLGFSNQAVSKQLKKLINQRHLRKTGKPPKVFYFLQEESKMQIDFIFEEKLKKTIEDNFLLITPVGEIKEGTGGFAEWCTKHNLSIAKTASEYVKTLKKYHAYQKDGLINGMKKIESTFKHVFLDHLYYLDFYSIERFGKTRLGQMLLYAKQSQNREFIRTLTEEIKPRINQLIEKHKINAVGFIPPTVRREVQFMKELQRNLDLDIPTLSIVKPKTPIIVPQKTLKNLDDRVENAKMTLIVEGDKKYQNILLIDDAVGSGSTLNETAAQIKAKNLCKGKIIGLAITGSFKGFDVISEV